MQPNALPSELASLTSSSSSLTAASTWVLVGFAGCMLALGLFMVRDARRRGTFRSASCVPEFERENGMVEEPVRPARTTTDQNHS